MLKKIICVLLVMLCLSSVIVRAIPANTISDFKENVTDLQKQLYSVSESMFTNDLKSQPQTSSISRLDTIKFVLQDMDKSLDNLSKDSKGYTIKDAKTISLAIQYLMTMTDLLNSYVTSDIPIDKYEAFAKFINTNILLNNLMNTI